MRHIITRRQLLVFSLQDVRSIESFIIQVKYVFVFHFIINISVPGKPSRKDVSVNSGTSYNPALREPFTSKARASDSWLLTR